MSHGIIYFLENSFMSKENPTVKELYELVRKDMIWKGKAIEKKLVEEKSAELWLQEENITQGTFAVKSAALHDNYSKWCKERGMDMSTVLNMMRLGKFLGKHFESTDHHGINHYYINKMLVEDEENRKKRQEEYKKRNQKIKETNAKNKAQKAVGPGTPNVPEGSPTVS